MFIISLLHLLEYIHECSFNVNHCTDFLYKTLFSAKPLNPLPDNLLVKYTVFVAKATSFFESARELAFYYDGGKKEVKNCMMKGKTKVPGTLPHSQNTEKE